MKVKNSTISNLQLMFIIIGLFQGSALTVSFAAETAKQDMWIIVIISAVLMVPLFLEYIYMEVKFYGNTIIEINDIIYGKYIGKIVSLLYINFFGFITFANFGYMADFFKTYMFDKTNIMIFICGIAFVAIYAIKKGIEVIARITPIIVILTLVEVPLLIVFTIKDTSIRNFLPIFQINFHDLVKSINLMIAIPFGELISCMTIFPYVKNADKIKKYSFIGYTIGVIFLVAVVVRNTAVLGNIGQIQKFQSYQVAKDLEIGEVMTRNEILVALILFFDVFVKICVTYHATVLSIAQVFKLKSYKGIVVPVGIVSIIQAFFMISSTKDFGYYTLNIYPVFSLLFIVVIPIISLIILYFRRLSV